jgi:sulfide:quinone oxidoreductase
LQLPPAVASPFGVRLTAQPPLKDRLEPVILRRGSIASVSTTARQVRLDDGGLIGYEALLVAVGGRPRAPFRGAITYGLPGSEARMHGLVQDLEAGYVKRVAFVVPPGATWALPVYELALMTAERAFDMCASVELTRVTPERRVLDGVGDAMSDEATSLLDAAGVAIKSGSQAVMTSAGTLELRPSGEQLEIDWVVTLPVLDGPALDGLPHDDAGSLTIDGHGRVAGAPVTMGRAAATSSPRAAITEVVGWRVGTRVRTSARWPTQRAAARAHRPIRGT